MSEVTSHNLFYLSLFFFMERIIKRLEEFVAARNWEQFHTPKNLSMSIAIEAAELMEHFQWNDTPFQELSEREAIEEEVADVMIYCLLFLNYMGSSIEEVLMHKIRKNETKYGAI